MHVCDVGGVITHQSSALVKQLNPVDCPSPTGATGETGQQTTPTSEDHSLNPVAGRREGYVQKRGVVIITS